MQILYLLMKDIKRYVANPFSVFLMLAIPIALSGILGTVFNPENPVLPTVKVLIVDMDHDFVSELLKNAYQRKETSKYFSLEFVANVDEGRERIKSENAAGLIIIPEGFTKAVLERSDTTLIFEPNPSMFILPRIAKSSLEIISMLISELTRILNDPLNDIISGYTNNDHLTDDQIARISISIAHQLRTVSDYVFPPLVEINEISEDNRKTDFNMMSIIFPGIMIMGLFFLSEIILHDVFSEKENRTAERLFTAGISLNQIYVSKFVFSVLFCFCSSLVLIGLGGMIFHIHWGNIPLVILVALISSIAISGCLSLILSFVSTSKQATTVASIFILLMSMFGGSLIPIQLIPESFHMLSKLTPTYWSVKAFTIVILGSKETLSGFTMCLVVLSGFGFTSFILSQVVLKTLRRNSIV